jgi:hypothetical protein
MRLQTFESRGGLKFTREFRKQYCADRPVVNRIDHSEREDWQGYDPPSPADMPVVSLEPMARAVKDEHREDDNCHCQEKAKTSETDNSHFGVVVVHVIFLSVHVMQTPQCIIAIWCYQLPVAHRLFSVRFQNNCWRP